jgi:hypothetical protein
LAALFWRESFAAAKAQGKDPATITSPAGAVGIGQIMPLHVGEKTPWGHTVTQSDLVNPEFNIRWSMWYFSQQAKYGSPDAAYNQGYNPGYTGPAAHVDAAEGLRPAVGAVADGQGDRSARRRPRQPRRRRRRCSTSGRPSTRRAGSSSRRSRPVEPPKNVLKYGGSPLTQTTFNQIWKQTYADTFFAYTGRQAKGTEIKGILATPRRSTRSRTTSPRQGLPESPVWKQHAPGLVSYARTASSGYNWKPSGGIIRKAIAQNWDQATFYANLKKRPRI